MINNKIIVAEKSKTAIWFIIKQSSEKLIIMKTLFLSFISTLIIFTVNAQTLVAYYPFNGNANDASGNGNHGTLMNGAGFCNDRFNIANSSLRLTNATAHVSSPFFSAKIN